jgi:hypothetical protein
MRSKQLGERVYGSRLAGYFNWQSAQLLQAVGALVWLALPLSAGAMTPISQGYTSSEKLAQGAIVSLQDNSTDHVVAAAISNVNNLLGVVINNDSSLLSVSDGTDKQVQVATSGNVPVLVSDINGTVKRGDQVTASPINGVGMKATANIRVIGTAQSDLGNASKQKYKDKDGKEKEVTLGQVPVLINVSYYFKESEKTVIPSALQNVANSLAGKEVSTLPIIISAAIFIVTLIVVVSIIYSMIRSSIISVGRNPMAQSAVYRDVIQLSSLVIIILGVALIAIYMILKRL